MLGEVQLKVAKGESRRALPPRSGVSKKTHQVDATPSTTRRCQADYHNTTANAKAEPERTEITTYNRTKPLTRQVLKVFQFMDRSRTCSSLTSWILPTHPFSSQRYYASIFPERRELAFTNESGSVSDVLITKALLTMCRCHKRIHSGNPNDVPGSVHSCFRYSFTPVLSYDSSAA